HARDIMVSIKGSVKLRKSRAEATKRHRSANWSNSDSCAFLCSFHCLTPPEAESRMQPKEIHMSDVLLFLVGIGAQELIIILVILLILFGGSRLPSLATGLGESVRNFKQGISEDPDDVKKRDEKSRVV